MLPITVSAQYVISVPSIVLVTGLLRVVFKVFRRGIRLPDANVLLI